jgi:hypothetical protein
LNSDFRVSVGVFSNAKVLRLMKRLGSDGLLHLFKLWAHAAVHRPDGLFADRDEVELATQWMGKDGELTATLLDLRLLDEVEGAVAVHDWHEWNPWASGASDRSELARRNAHKRYCLGPGACDKPFCANGRQAEGRQPANRTATALRPACKPQSGSTATAERRQSDGTAPSPLLSSPPPSPLPTPTPTPEPPPAQTTQQKAVATVTALFTAASVPAPPPALVAQWLQRHAWDADHVSALVSRYAAKGADYLTKVVNNPTNQKSASANGAGENDDKFAALVADIPVHRL